VAMCSTSAAATVSALYPSGRATTIVYRVAAAAERPSEHPLAAAITAAAHEQGIDLPQARAFTSAPGQGVSAEVDGHTVRVGSPAVLDELSPALAGRRITAQAAAAVTAAQEQARTAIVVVIDGAPAGVVALADRLRPDAGPQSRACRHSPATHRSC